MRHTDKLSSITIDESPASSGVDPFASAKLLQEIWEFTSPALKHELATRLVAKFYDRINNAPVEVLDPFIDAKLRELLYTIELPSDVEEKLKDKLRAALRGVIEAKVRAVADHMVSTIATTVSQRLMHALKGLT